MQDGEYFTLLISGENFSPRIWPVVRFDRRTMCNENNSYVLNSTHFKCALSLWDIRHMAMMAKNETGVNVTGLTGHKEVLMGKILWKPNERLDIVVAVYVGPLLIPIVFYVLKKCFVHQSGWLT